MAWPRVCCASLGGDAIPNMMELGRAYPPLMQIAGDLMAKNLDWPGADDIAERLKAMLPPPGADLTAEYTERRQCLRHFCPVAQ